MRKGEGMEIRKIEAESGSKMFLFAPAVKLAVKRVLARFFKCGKSRHFDPAAQSECPRGILRAGAKSFGLVEIRTGFIARFRRRPFGRRIFFRLHSRKIETSLCGAAFAFTREKCARDSQREFALENSAAFPIRLPF